MNNPEIITAYIAAVAALVVAGINFVVTSISTRKNERDLAHLETSLRKVEKLEASRSAGYEDIWKLTESLNLFGSQTKVNATKLLDDLTNWYFEHGWVLSPGSKKRYFLIQEALHFIYLRKLDVTRPSDESLFGNRERPIKQRREMRKATLGVKIIREKGTLQNI